MAVLAKIQISSQPRSLASLPRAATTVLTALIIFNSFWGLSRTVLWDWFLRHQETGASFKIFPGLAPDQASTPIYPATTGQQHGAPLATLFAL
ncbi:unnamed protein product, partial [Tilletia controversa]